MALCKLFRFLLSWPIPFPFSDQSNLFCSLPEIDRANLPVPEGLDLEGDLQRLEDAGLLSSRNRMSLAELLNPEDETPDFTTIPTAEEIFDQVNAPEPDHDVDEPEPEPVPTTAEAAAAVSVLLAHIEGTETSAGLNLDKFLQKYADMLQSELYFGNKKQSVLTDFFNEDQQ